MERRTGEKMHAPVRREDASEAEKIRGAMEAGGGKNAYRVKAARCRAPSEIPRVRKGASGKNCVIYRIRIDKLDHVVFRKGGTPSGT